MQHKDARNASFIAAGRDGELSRLKTLLAMNADVYAKDSEGSTALHRAAEGGHGDVAALLLQEGGQRLAAMPNGRGQTARDLAALQQRELDVTKTGVQGSSVNVVSILDSTMRALDSAALQVSLRPHTLEA
jgi:ankyrin repeat protein